MASKISIVTPTYNQGEYIEQTICSVLDQKYPDLEYIIIDGGSIDNTVEIIKKYQHHLTHWVSEKDNGQANAINKGLQYCTGEIFNWLNSDDYLESGALLKIASQFEAPGIELVAGKVNNFSRTGSEVVANQHLSAAGLMCWKPGVQFIQPGVWMRKKNVLACGGIDEQFNFAFDWDLLIRYLYYFPNTSYLGNVIVNFRLHEDSKTVSSREKFDNEERSIIEKIYHDERFKNIHSVCKWKMSHSHWTKLLKETADSGLSTKKQKLTRIVKNLHHQPRDVKAIRMTLGAVKRILLNDRISK